MLFHLLVAALCTLMIREAIFYNFTTYNTWIYLAILKALYFVAVIFLVGPDQRLELNYLNCSTFVGY